MEKTDILIIDEVSMMSIKLFEILDRLVVVFERNKGYLLGVYKSSFRATFINFRQWEQTILQTHQHFALKVLIGIQLFIVMCN